MFKFSFTGILCNKFFTLIPIKWYTFRKTNDMGGNTLMLNIPLTGSSEVGIAHIFYSLNRMKNYFSHV